MGYPFRNLVFEGGGVKGLAYVGALQVFQQKGILPASPGSAVPRPGPSVHCLWA